MDIGTLLSVIQTLLAALDCSQLQDVWSIWGYKSDLDELNSVVSTVKKVLLDAEAKHDQLSQETLLYIEELRDALYDADDLLDEFVTLAKQKQLMEDDKFIKKVCLFFSHFNQLGVAYNMSQGVKKIMNKLDSIASKHSKFGLSLDHQPIIRRRDETCSYPENEIIGRDEDLEKIVDMLLHPHVKQDVSFLTVVGVGGLGKTALSQLVYNHEKIMREFSSRLWICVSDNDDPKLDVKTILTQILETATRTKHDGYSMEVVVAQLREVLAGKRFLIVLDDLWTESRDEWQHLAGHLVGNEGSQIVVTTRSKETAKIVGNGLTYELKGLSDESSWRLFQLMAFAQVPDQASPNCYVHLMNIGRDIVKMCANVPLAIRVIGRLLYGQDKSKWLSVLELGLANLREGKNGIMPILKLSYYNLEYPLKSCFSYCALYPKDFRIQKELMIDLWIAQGYVVPLEKGQSIEDAGEEYFLILLQKCFFQDVQKDEFGEIYSFKLHDLMHDVALKVAEKEICPSCCFTGDMEKLVRHISLIRSKQYENFCFIKTRIRTYLYVATSHMNKGGVLPSETLVQLLVNNKHLRALDLSGISVKTLPASIGKLIHLRYLDLSNNRDLKVLPNSITKLFNLQTLNLENCSALKELPKDLSKLVNLRVLGLLCCYGLTFMPSGMGKLTNLYTLSMFVAGVGNSGPKLRLELESLKALKKLRGSIVIKIYLPKSGGFVIDDTIRERAYIRDNERLNTISFMCTHEVSSGGAIDYEEEFLGALQPHANLKVLKLMGYNCGRMPRWAKEDNLATFLPNLVHLHIHGCSKLQCLPSLGKLQHLKSLFLLAMPSLEYIESHTQIGVGLRFLPCLEQLTLRVLPKLKEWWGRSGKRVTGDNSISSRRRELHQSSLFLSHLKNLTILNCPELTSLPNCPNLEMLTLSEFNERLRITSNLTRCPKLREVHIDNIAWLQSSLPIESFQSLSRLEIKGDKEAESLTDLEQVFRACSSSLKIFGICECPKLSTLSGVLGYLTALEELFLYGLAIVNLAVHEIDGDDEMPWRSLCQTLHSMYVINCKKLQSFPKWMQKLTSLRFLRIAICSKELYKRCQNPNGEDWPNIRHISTFISPFTSTE